jgi:hypothetical protein
MDDTCRGIFQSVEGLYCKSPIQCLASSEILTPQPLTALRVCTLKDLVRGEDARHCSVLYISKYFVFQSVTHHVLKLLE